MPAICGLCGEKIDDIDFHLTGKCQKKPCPQDCAPSAYYAKDHHMEGMYCKHCGRAFCIVTPDDLNAANMARIITQDIERNGPLSYALWRAIVEWINRGAIRVQT